MKDVFLCSLMSLGAAAEMRPVLGVALGSPVRQVRAAPVRLGRDAKPAFMAAYGPDVEVDPYHEMFYYPQGTLRSRLEII